LENPLIEVTTVLILIAGMIYFAIKHERKAENKND